MTVRATILATCCVIGCQATPAGAQQSGAPRPEPQYIFETTAGMNGDICYWASAPYSGGAQIGLPQGDRDPHVRFQFFTCHEGNWTRE
jgi:hypothetical protein